MSCYLTSTMLSLFSRFSRLTLNSGQARLIHTQATPLFFNTTCQQWAAPMKKKKKLDPALLHQREQKKKKKIERQIKKLERFGRQLKPIEEIAGDPKLKRETESRKRETTVLTFEASEERALLHKAWSRYKMKLHQHEQAVVSAALNSQQRALQELRAESEELYQKAIQIDEELLPLDISGPVETPRIKEFDPCDGEYTDKTRMFDK